MPDGSEPTPAFEAELLPHRSLSRRGLAILLGFLCVVSLGVTTLFWSMGAWPVAGFNGADLLLVGLVLRASVLARREREHLVLVGDEVRVTRTGRDGRASSRRFAASWLGVELRERPGRVPGLYLVQRGEAFEIAALLGEAEKRDFARAFTEALRRWRTPVFDNPQLRD